MVTGPMGKGREKIKLSSVLCSAGAPIDCDAVEDSNDLDDDGEEDVDGVDNDEGDNDGGAAWTPARPPDRERGGEQGTRKYGSVISSSRFC
ncbi:unnamed protein product [Haemonchus placei]|uniref:Uncharacterized protein n=1 Tax=Haemonchus placei TaxID=6290 RepID=A0A0N4X2G8_HAEPC|nr:unnamed protein product [Haemonchus placei]